MAEFSPIREWHDVDEGVFREQIEPLYEPAVLRGIAGNWPSVHEGKKSPQAIANYLKKLDRGGVSELFIGEKAIAGKYFYSDDLQSMNFSRKKEHFHSAIDKILRFASEESEQSAYLGSTPTHSCIPDFSQSNKIPLVDPEIEARIWINNQSTVSSHYDMSDNLACVVSGQRQFTLISPHQIDNMYVGPLDFTIAGQAVSMADLDAPDLALYPRFEHALQSAQSAILEAGDAIYIPALWWHHVKSLSSFNVLVNYWWLDSVQGQGNGFDALIHGIFAIRSLPEKQRAAWRAIFDHYIFGKEGIDPTAHLPEASRGILAPLTPRLADTLRKFLLRTLSR